MNDAFTASLGNENVATTAPGPHSRSCGVCHRRKIKCDRTYPCSHCVKTQTECVFPPPGTRIRRHRKSKDSSDKDSDLRERFTKLQGALQELTGLVSTQQTTYGASQAVDQVPSRNQDEVETEMGKLVISDGKIHYLGNEFWAKLTTELENVQEEINDFDSEEDEFSSNTHTTPSTLPITDSTLLMYGYSSSDVEISAFHPLPSQVMFYWEIYLERVETLCNIFHVSTMTETMKRSKNELCHLSKPMEALMFAIYLAAVTSMTDDEVQKNLGSDRNELMRKYRFALQQALARAQFLKTSEFITVQALVLSLLLYDKDEDSRTHWAFTGSALRVAQAIGLHRDGTFLGLSPFETEMRRRLWWLLVAVEIRAALLFGADPSIGAFSFDTKLPSNINDTDLDPQSTKPIESRIGMTQTSLVLVRHELSQTQLRLAHDGLNGIKEMSLAGKEEIIQNLANHLEATYFSHYNLSDPVLVLCAKIMRTAVATLRLCIYGVQHGGQTQIIDALPQEVRDSLFQLCIDDIEITNEVINNPLTQKFAWSLQTHIHWAVMAYLLREIARRPPSEFVERGWRAVMSVFKAWGDRVRSGDNLTLWTPMRKLMAEAKRKRLTHSSAQERRSTSTDSVPQFASSISDGIQTDTSSVFNAPATNSWGKISSSQAPVAASSYDATGLQIQQGLPYQEHTMDQDQSMMWLDDSGMLDLQMGVMDGGISWAGWDDVVRDFQINFDRNGNGGAWAHSAT